MFSNSFLFFLLVQMECLLPNPNFQVGRSLLQKCKQDEVPLRDSMCYYLLAWYYYLFATTRTCYYLLGTTYRTIPYIGRPE